MVWNGNDLWLMSIMFENWNRGVARARRQYYLEQEPRRCRKLKHPMLSTNVLSNGACRECYNARARGS